MKHHPFLIITAMSSIVTISSANGSDCCADGGPCFNDVATDSRDSDLAAVEIGLSLGDCDAAARGHTDDGPDSLYLNDDNSLTAGTPDGPER